MRTFYRVSDLFEFNLVHSTLQSMNEHLKHFGTSRFIHSKFQNWQALPAENKHVPGEGLETVSAGEGADLASWDRAGQ